MQGHRRGEIEIMRDILEVCLRGANKTKIVYGANLNFSRLERYFRTLLSLGFIAEEDDPLEALFIGLPRLAWIFLVAV